jgi:hypothetical protein
MIHIIMSLILFSPAYYGKFFLDPNEATSKMNSIGENSLFFAVLAVSFYAIIGICSLPSVGMNMTNKQWQLVYGPLAWTALAFATVHVLVMGVKGWNDQETWPGSMPPVTLTSTVFPLFVMGLKLIQIFHSFIVDNCCRSESREDYAAPEITIQFEEETATLVSSRALALASNHADMMDSSDSCSSYSSELHLVCEIQV